MKPLKNAESLQSAPTNYAPSVPMSVYRELAAELRANKAVIDSLNGRNQQLIQQNQRLKKEIHNVVQATLSLGQFAGVARPAGQDSFPNAIGPDTLAKLVRAQGEANKTAETTSVQDAVPPAPGLYSAQEFLHSPVQNAPQQPYPQQGYQPQQAHPQAHSQQAKPQQARSQQARPQQSSRQVPPTQPRQRVPQPIQSKGHPGAPAGQTIDQAMGQTKRASSNAKLGAKPNGRVNPQAKARPGAKTQQRPTALTRPASPKRTDVAMATKPAPKLFTEQSGEYRSSVLDSPEEKEIGGIWLALSIILIIVTAFGAGFLIMKPLLNDR